VGERKGCERNKTHMLRNSEPTPLHKHHGPTILLPFLLPFLHPFLPSFTQSNKAPSSSTSLGWRVTRRLLHERLAHEEDKYHTHCRRHHPLLLAIDGEIRRLSSSPSSSSSSSAGAGAGAAAAAGTAAAAAGAAAGATPARAAPPPSSFPSSSSSSSSPSPLNGHHHHSPSSPSPAAAFSGPPSLPPSLPHHHKEDPLESELRHLDDAAAMENKLHLWARLHTVVSRTITLSGSSGGGGGGGGGGRLVGEGRG